MSSEIIVFVTCPKDSAEKLATTLVEERLAACVNIVPGVTSIYSWQGDICKDREELLVIKSHQSQWHHLQERIKNLHTYDVPEIISVSIADGYKPYLEWLTTSVQVP